MYYLFHANGYWYSLSKNKRLDVINFELGSQNKLFSYMPANNLTDIVLKYLINNSIDGIENKVVFTKRSGITDYIHQNIDFCKKHSKSFKQYPA